MLIDEDSAEGIMSRDDAVFAPLATCTWHAGDPIELFGDRGRPALPALDAVGGLLDEVVRQVGEGSAAIS